MSAPPLFFGAERCVARELAATALPAGRLLPGAGESTLARAEALLAGAPPAIVGGYRALLGLLRLQGFERASPAARLRLLEGWAGSESWRLALRALLVPLKLAHFDDPAVHAALDCRYALDPPPREEARWGAQVTRAQSLPPGSELECDVVVVGTGAGGAPVARALAERGHAVLLVEEGEHETREGFTGRPVEMMRKLYRRGGFTVAFGNTAIPIPIGRAVGGTTLINSGTCFRLPEPILRSWRTDHGLTELTPEALAPFYEEVERELGVGPSSPAAIGKTGELIARGCDALGYSHQPLARNAPGCDGQGLCCFGCPTDAKRSTNVSFVPRALERGAQLLTGLRVERLLLDGERAAGVEGRTGSGERVVVRARAVVLSCGALETPALLLRNGLANGSGELGKNLSIHPASNALALFDERVDSARSVPQGYAIDQFAGEGILFEGASVPLDLTSASLPGFGPGHVALMERFDQTLGFGFMVKDQSRGRVRVGRGGDPVVTYWLGREDRDRLRKGMGILARVFFAAGAREVHAPVVGHERLRGLRDVERLERAPLAARQIDLTAYHPLGTARMGVDPRRSVVGPSHETHDVPGLFVVDGAAVPSSLGVNPQVTIMALALRAAEHVGRRLE